MNAVADKFEQFEWLTHGITAKSPQFSDEAHGTGEKPLDYQDRLGAIASMETQLEKSITSVIVFGESSKGDFEFIQDHLANIMVVNAEKDNRLKPKNIELCVLANRVALMVLLFALDPEYEANFTAKGRLYAGGIKSYEMDSEAYRKTWKQYENLMVIALETSIKCASGAVEKYRKNTYRELKV
ncbi:hypothetical protein [Acinetobacter sp. ANC 4648]|uniref:hypothetical protein n=1 Tax=Acinetobacter sp. ANC 4648 TaxID=1977875 RepID=UPI000A34556B|nr:hypothetical protein [Acinetobacter sp. ANC 4648]OTG81777.1 hypothetical protein B9T27_09520 [Acinetobacter sp. ANC 4648]